MYQKDVFMIKIPKKSVNILFEPQPNKSPSFPVSVSDTIPSH